MRIRRRAVLQRADRMPSSVLQTRQTLLISSRPDRDPTNRAALSSHRQTKNRHHQPERRLHRLHHNRAIQQPDRNQAGDQQFAKRGRAASTSRVSVHRQELVAGAAEPGERARSGRPAQESQYMH